MCWDNNNLLEAAVHAVTLSPDLFSRSEASFPKGMALAAACDRAARLLVEVAADPADDALRPALSEALRAALLGEPEAGAAVDPRAALLERTAARLGPGWRDGAFAEGDDALLARSRSRCARRALNLALLSIAHSLPLAASLSRSRRARPDARARARQLFSIVLPLSATGAPAPAAPAGATVLGARERASST